MCMCSTKNDLHPTAYTIILWGVIILTPTQTLPLNPKNIFIFQKNDPKSVNCRLFIFKTANLYVSKKSFLNENQPLNQVK